jgi:5-methylcytosine-specific restriction endonuclease McrA
MLRRGKGHKRLNKAKYHRALRGYAPSLAKVEVYVSKKPEKIELPEELPNNNHHRKRFIKSFCDGDMIRCGICKGLFASYEDITVDHIVPRGKGGKNHKNNVQPTHRKCNNVKGSMKQGDPRILQRLKGFIKEQQRQGLL